jgi:hypothetical protein
MFYPRILQSYQMGLFYPQELTKLGCLKQKKSDFGLESKTTLFKHFFDFFFLAVSEVRPEKVSQGWPRIRITL